MCIAIYKNNSYYLPLERRGCSFCSDAQVHFRSILFVSFTALGFGTARISGPVIFKDH